MGAWFGRLLSYTQENIANHGIYLKLQRQEPFPSFETEDTDKIRR